MWGPAKSHRRKKGMGSCGRPGPGFGRMWVGRPACAPPEEHLEGWWSRERACTPPGMVHCDAPNKREQCADVVAGQGIALRPTHRPPLSIPPDDLPVPLAEPGRHVRRRPGPVLPARKSQETRSPLLACWSWPELAGPPPGDHNRADREITGHAPVCPGRTDTKHPCPWLAMRSFGNAGTSAPPPLAEHRGTWLRGTDGVCQGEKSVHRRITSDHSLRSLLPEPFSTPRRRSALLMD